LQQLHDHENGRGHENSEHCANEQRFRQLPHHRNAQNRKELAAGVCLSKLGRLSALFGRCVHIS
jgi:hypothetical protein